MENFENTPVSGENQIKRKRSVNSRQSTFLLYLHDLVYLLAVMIVVLLLLFRIVVVSGSSMKNTLVDGDYLLLISNVFYREPQREDIVVISKETFDDGKPIVKRVIATEGQLVDIDFVNGIVYVDKVALEEPYLSTPTTNFEGVQFPLTVDAGCVFVMGDNREGSKDSRDPEIGQVDRREILGKVIFLLLPGNDKGTQSPDYGRIGVVS